MSLEVSSTLRGGGCTLSRFDLAGTNVCKLGSAEAQERPDKAADMF